MIAVITDPAVGGTFLTWSIYYLSGKTQYFSIGDQINIELPVNPLINKNAHNFNSNHPENLNDLKKDLQIAAEKNLDECIYIHQFRSDTKIAVDLLCKSASKIVVLSRPQSLALYHCRYMPRNETDTAWCSDRTLSTADDIFEDFITYFFGHSKEKWKRENLTNTWDKREFIALNFKPFNCNCIVDYIDQSIKYHCIDTTDLWTTFDSSISDLFKYLDLTVDEDRYNLWLPIYIQWKANHINSLQFIQNFDIIVDCILQGREFDLTKFDLDICQEAAIQHALIFNHNLNFKTWQLGKFTNAIQLHNLLEPNMHKLNKRIIN
jgi:hypothetical protein